MKSICPVCGRINCYHTSKERGQTLKEVYRDLTQEEKDLLAIEPIGSSKLIALAVKNAHLPNPA